MDLKKLLGVKATLNDALREIPKIGSSRELSVVMTKLEEANMWLEATMRKEGVTAKEMIINKVREVPTSIVAVRELRVDASKESEIKRRGRPAKKPKDQDEDGFFE